MRRIHVYPLRTLLADYGRGVVGVAVSGTFWVVSPATVTSMALFGGLTGLFLLFILRTLLRQRQRIWSTETGVGMAGRAPVAWQELDELSLRYYAVRRTKGRGWMTLRLRAAGRKLAIDSTLDGFEEIAARAAQAAAVRGLDLSEVTAANLAYLGLPVRGATQDVAYGAGR